MRVLIVLAALPFSLLATSWVDIRLGPAYDAFVHPGSDCVLKDKAIKAIRIETAIFNDDGQEIRRATLRTCSRVKSTEEHWTYTLDSDGSVLNREKEVTTFDDHGRVLEEAQHTWDDGHQAIRRSQYSYDEVGRSLGFRMVDTDGSAHAWRNTLDERGDPVIVTGIDSDGQIESTTRSQFDDQHHLLSERINDGPANHHLKYDPQGRLIEEVTAEGRNKNTFLYTYDDQGRRLSKRTIIGSSQQTNWRDGFSYWPNGLIKEEWSFDSSGTATRFESYVYDEHDHMTQRWVYSPGKQDRPKKFLVTVDGSLQTFGDSNCLPLFTYYYDLHGNWVKAVETRLSDFDEPTSDRDVTAIYYRQIEYQ